MLRSVLFFDSPTMRVPRNVCRVSRRGNDRNACIDIIKPLKQHLLQRKGLLRIRLHQVAILANIRRQLVELHPWVVAPAILDSVAIEVDQFPLAGPHGAERLNAKPDADVLIPLVRIVPIHPLFPLEPTAGE